MAQPPRRRSRLVTWTLGVVAPWVARGLSQHPQTPPAARRGGGLRDERWLAPHVVRHHCAAVALAVVAAATAPAVASSDQVLDGTRLFAANCAVCHAGGASFGHSSFRRDTPDRDPNPSGGNVVTRGKTLDRADLDQYGYGTREAIEMIIARGRGAMPGFGSGCEPDEPACAYKGRLDTQQIADLAEWVERQADAGWPLEPVGEE